MLVLAVIGRRRGATRLDQRFYADAERDACAELRAAQVLRLALHRADGRGVVLLMEAPTRRAALALLDALPAVEMGASCYRTLEVEMLPGSGLGDVSPSGETYL